MEQNEIYKILSLLKDRLENGSKVKALPNESKIIIGRETGTSSIFMLLLVFGAVYLFLFADVDLSKYSFTTIIATIAGVGFIVYEIFKINRTILIDFENQLFKIRYFSLVTSEHYFTDFNKVINTTQIVNRKYRGVTLKIEFNDKSIYEIAHFKNQEDINAMNIVFNIVKQYGTTHTIVRENPFIEKMKKLTDEELIATIRKREGYNKEAQNAMKIIGLERNLIDNNWNAK